MKGALSTKIISLVGAWLQKNRGPKRHYLCDFNKIQHNIQLGDVLLVEGRNRAGRIIKRLTISSWTHSMLYIGRLHDIEDPKLRARLMRFYKGPPSKRLVIEAQLGQGTIVTELDDYADDHIRICRPIGLTYEDAHKVMAYAIKRLGSAYSVRHIFDLMRFLFPWSILPRRWRSSLFSHHALKPTEEICSTMIVNAFATVNFPILPEIQNHEKRGLELTRRNPRLITPSDFDYSPYFEIIKYPIFGVRGHFAYRGLPWRSER